MIALLWKGAYFLSPQHFHIAQIVLCKPSLILVRLATLSIEHTKKPISAVEIDLDYILFFKLPWPGVEPGLQYVQYTSAFSWLVA